ncbi:hypothetical protein OG264_19515 [Streptomyces xanthophaeus]|uniref:hypothetical protein n=1 Tax=Streptomyces xanthophaeus TaxID=67385 RepID=UPI00386CA9F0|nr:hypothetical protein OG264_19515 [Streptomyces xanthophaeus]WST61521.1 hypothetical protein OG605_18925 [Streptomyces xanthophaeus]
MAGSGNPRTAGARSRRGRALCAVFALVLFSAATLTGLLAIAALGWTGTPGVLTALACHEQAKGKGSTTSCYSTFVPDDRHALPEAVSVDWPRGTEGATKHVRTTALGVHQKEDALDAVLLLVVTAGLCGAGALAAFAALPLRARTRLTAALPSRQRAPSVRRTR